MVPEAPLERTDTGIVPAAEGWFVVNVREARWFETDGSGFYVSFEGEKARFPELGVGLGILNPGEPNALYHAEDAQEDFLVLAGECLLLVEGHERRLRAWDFVHCAPWTEPSSSEQETFRVSWSALAHGERDAASSFR